MIIVLGWPRVYRPQPDGPLAPGGLSAEIALEIGRVGVAVEVVGEEDVWAAEPMMGAEDFAILAREAPGAFLWVGAALPDAREHHNPRFDIDESVLPRGAELLARLALQPDQPGDPAS